MPDVVDEFGLQVATLDELRAKNAADVRAAPEFSPDADVAPDTVLGSVFEPLNAQLDDVRQLLRSVADAGDPDNAEGVWLDSVSALSGVDREDATKSQGTVRLTGTPFLVIPAGSRVKLPTIDDTDAELLEDATIDGFGSIDAIFRALVTGPINYAHNITLTIVTPVGGWTSAVVFEPITLGFSLGRDIEVDGEMRIRRGNSLSIGGNATFSAVGAAVAALPDVDYAVAVENDTLLPDTKGIPGKAMRVIVHPSTVDEQRIVNTMYATWPGGIESDGSNRFTVLTSKNQEKEFGFDFATPVEIWVIIDLTPQPGYGGDAAVQAAVLAYAADSINVGTDIDPADIICRIIRDVAGAGNPKVKIGKTDPPTLSDIIELDIDEIGTFDAARITVNS